MADIKLFYHKDGIVRLSRSLEFLKSNPIHNFLWIDLNDVDEEVESELEDFLKIYIQEEEEMILSVCRNSKEEELMRSCTYAYQYPANLVLKSFREEKKDRK